MTNPKITEAEELTKKVNESLNDVQEFKKKHPYTRTPYSTNMGSLLNAYREGDIDFDEVLAFHKIHLKNAHQAGFEQGREEERERIIKNIEGAIIYCQGTSFNKNIKNVSGLLQARKIITPNFKALTPTTKQSKGSDDKI